VWPGIVGCPSAGVPEPLDAAIGPRDSGGGVQDVGEDHPKAFEDQQEPAEDVELGPVFAGRVRQLAIESNFSCALTEGGEVYCWGQDRGPSFLSANPYGDYRRAQHISELHDIIQVSVTSSGHACALERTGLVWCWGFNYDGSLGVDGSETRIERPRRVSGIAGATHIATAYDGRSFVRMADGNVYYWGAFVRPLQRVPGLETAAEVHSSNWLTCSRLTRGGHACQVGVQFYEFERSNNSRSCGLRAGAPKKPRKQRGTGPELVVDPGEDRRVAPQVPLADSAERPEEVADSRPDSFLSIAMDFPDSIAVVIACPFRVARIVRNRLVNASQVLHTCIATPLIRIDRGSFLSRLLHMIFQSWLIGAFGHVHSHLPGLTSDRSDDRWTIVLERSVAWTFVAATAWRILGIEVRNPLLPGVLEHLVDFRFLVAKSRGGESALGRALEGGVASGGDCLDRGSSPRPSVELEFL